MGEDSLLGKHLVVCNDLGPIGCCTMEKYDPFDWGRDEEEDGDHEDD